MCRHIAQLPSQQAPTWSERSRFAYIDSHPAQQPAKRQRRRVHKIILNESAGERTKARVIRHHITSLVIPFSNPIHDTANCEINFEWGQDHLDYTDYITWISSSVAIRLNWIATISSLKRIVLRKLQLSTKGDFGESETSRPERMQFSLLPKSSMQWREAFQSPKRYTAPLTDWQENEMMKTKHKYRIPSFYTNEQPLMLMQLFYFVRTVEVLDIKPFDLLDASSIGRHRPRVLWGKIKHSRCVI